jgi:23S rRNA (adenine2503-C2)-methyltransferase
LAAKKRGSDGGKVRLADLSPEELTDFVVSMGEKPYRGKQIASWIFARGCSGFEEMSDISKASRDKLAAVSTARSPVSLAESETDGSDGSRRLLWRLEDGELIESVVLDEGGHLTLCVSSQIGCRMGCRFCRTGTLGLKRNLTQGEILGQVLGAVALVPPEDGKITNVVFMGMGEPLDNADNVLRSLKIMTAPQYLAIAGRHISLSTVGVVPRLEQIAARGGLKCGLTISLGAADDELRSSVMPCNRRWPLARLKETLLAFPLPRGRRLTVAYVLLAGVNDSPEHAWHLSKFLTGLKVKINLIPFNPWPGAPYERPAPWATAAFQDVLVDKYHTAQIRTTKGASVNAACGLLVASAKAGTA